MSALASVQRSGSGSANQPSSPQDASGATSAKNMVSTSCFEKKLGCQTFHTFGLDHTCSIERQVVFHLLFIYAQPHWMEHFPSVLLWIITTASTRIRPRSQYEM